MPAGDRRPAAATTEQEQLACPRCESTNTKFCYYNNYNLSQPRHFCKACRRYWTRGGTLRNIPVGGATRKHAKRCRTAAAAPVAVPVSSPAPPPPQSDNAVASVSGSFTSLLSDSGMGLGFGFGLGFGSGGEGELGFEVGRGTVMWPLGDVGGGGGGGGDTWQIGIGGGGGEGEHHEQCFGWPELAISTSGKCAK